MRVVSIDGVGLNTEQVQAWLEVPFTQPALTLQTAEPQGGDPMVTAARRRPLAMALHVVIYGEEPDVTDLREEILAALDTETAAVALVVSDDDGGNERYRYVVTQSVDEQPNEEGTGQHLVATLVTHRETRWRKTTARTASWSPTASGQTTTVLNQGSLPARPIYTIKPTTAKSGPANAFEYRAFVAVTWTSDRAYNRYPIELTGGGWDTASLIGASKMGGEDNVAVFVDGAQKRRWIENFDDTDTKVWANLNFRPGARATMLSSLGSGDTVSALASATDIGRFPQEGLLLVGSEIFFYRDKDDASRTFLEVTRAARGSTAENHSADDAIHWVQHEIWLAYGGTGERATAFPDDDPDISWNTDYDHYAPILNKATSTNSAWVFGYFGANPVYTNLRYSANWLPGGAVGGANGVTTAGGTLWTAINLSVPDTEEARAGLEEDAGRFTSWWRLPLAYRFSSVRLIGQAEAFSEGTWDVAVWSGGQRYGAIPLPGTNNPGDEKDFDLTLSGGDSGGNDEIRIEQRNTCSSEITIEDAYLYFANESPAAELMGELTMYDLALTLENVTAGQAMTLTLPMSLNEEIAVDTAAHTVTLGDGTNQYGALTKDTRRKEILPLLPGTNTLRVTEDGLAGVTITMEWEERTYS